MGCSVIEQLVGYYYETISKNHDTNSKTVNG